MTDLHGGGRRADNEAERQGDGAQTPASDPAAARTVARVRWMMIISGLTTLVAIAAVIAATGYRVFHAGESGTTAPAAGIVTLPKGARVLATAVAGDRIVVTLDIAGTTEIRIFDAKTLRETGRVRFATEP